MRKLWLAVLLAPLAQAALVVAVPATTQTQAVLTITGFSGPCTLRLSTDPSFSPLAPDVNGTEYTGASTDTGRTDTFTQSSGAIRVVTLGHMIGDRALKTDTKYYVEVSVCGTTATTSFYTATNPVGSTTTWPIPFDSTKWGNLGYKQIDWSATTDQQVIDPLTGSELSPINVRNFWSWRTGGGPTGLTSATDAFADVAGGSGWTNGPNIINGSSSDASTSNTNPIDLYAPTSGAGENIRPWDTTTSAKSLEDVGIVLWGSSDNGARTFTACIIKNPNDGCYSQSITITATATSGTPAIHSSTTTSDPDFAWPNGFPSGPFASWGDALHYLRNEDYETTGTLNIGASGALTIPTPTSASHFSTTLKAGDRIFVTGTSPTCTNNVCTIASVTDAGHATISETPSTATGVTYRCYGWGIRITKSNATGTLTIGAKYKLAGSQEMLVQSLGDRCSPIVVTSGDGKTGNVCEVSGNTAVDYLYFISNTGVKRGITKFMLPPPARILVNGSAAASNDRPNISFYAAAPFGFDPVDGKTFYVAAKTLATGSPWSIYKAVYGGDFSTDFSQCSNYTGDTSGNMWLEQSPYLGPCNDQMTWSNIMPPTNSLDLVTQITTNHPEYNTTVYGATSASWQFAGCSGGYCYFQNSYSGQSNSTSGGPGWVAVINISTGLISNLIHTLDGTGAANARWGGLHNEQGLEYPNSTLFLSLDYLGNTGSAVLHGGPFKTSLTGVLRSGVFSADTSLPWPPDSTYDNTCPGSSPYANFGAAGDQCVTFKMTQPCNVLPSATELSTWPCGWNGSYAQPTNMAVGDFLVDYIKTAGSPPPGNPDTERFRILSITPISGNDYSVVAQRDAVQDYCCQSGHSNSYRGTCSGLTADAQHANGWTPMMSPGTVNSCAAASLVVDNTSSYIAEVGHDFGDHFGTGNGGGGTGVNFASHVNSKYHVPFANLADLPTVKFAMGDPAFAGNVACDGCTSSLQSYTNLGNFLQPNGPAMIDTNVFQIANETPTAGVDPARTITAVTGDVYRIEPISAFNGGGDGKTLTTAKYKTMPLVGYAGRYILQDVSGASSSVDSTPFSMCRVSVAGECHASSSVGQIYINVPKLYDPIGQCTAGLSWANQPCVIFGYSAPGGGVRQQRISAADSLGAYSRAITFGYSSFGRQYFFTHYVTHPSGQLVIGAGTNFVDGRSITGFTASVPTWNETGASQNDFVNVPIVLVAGDALAQIRWGYSRNIGPDAAPTTFACLQRTGDPCSTATVSGQPYSFVSEAGTGTSCASGCTINIPTHGPNLMYYGKYRSSDGGSSWHVDAADPDVHVLALGAPAGQLASSSLVVGGAKAVGNSKIQ